MCPLACHSVYHFLEKLKLIPTHYDLNVSKMTFLYPECKYSLDIDKVEDLTI